MRPFRRKYRRRPAGPRLTVPWIVTAAADIGLWLAHADRGGTPAPPAPEPQFHAFAQRMPICGGGRRISCVVDGDTFWVEREKVRRAGIDAPEVQGACASERRLAERATNRLSEILSQASFHLARTGVDRHGRTLARVETAFGEAGEILVREGLARPWRGHRENWCG